jgi:hypothetical protein
MEADKIPSIFAGLRTVHEAADTVIQNIMGRIQLLISGFGVRVPGGSLKYLARLRQI